MINTTKETCGCGKPIRYIIPGTDASLTGSCNKYGRCPTYEELLTKNKEQQEKLTQAKKEIQELLNYVTNKISIYRITEFIKTLP